MTLPSKPELETQVNMPSPAVSKGRRSLGKVKPRTVKALLDDVLMDCVEACAGFLGCAMRIDGFELVEGRNNAAALLLLPSVKTFSLTPSNVRRRYAPLLPSLVGALEDDRGTVMASSNNLVFVYE